MGTVDGAMIGISSGFHQVRGMAFVAAYAVARVGGFMKLALFLAAGVALFAALGVCLRRTFERENQFVACSNGGVIAMRGLFGVGVSLARAVANLAARDFAFLHRFQGGVDGFVELPKFGLVTGAAIFCAHVTG